MIESISISGVAAYPATVQAMAPLSQFNYLYGANGTGKTTIGRIIANSEEYPTCKVSWAGGVPLQPMVYNSDFVTRSFEAVDALQGVFTLGEDSVETLKRIADEKTKLNSQTDKLRQLRDTLEGNDGSGGKRAELVLLEEGFKDACFEQKRKHDAKFKYAFKGARNSAATFRDRVLKEKTSNDAELKPLAELETRAATVFGDAPQRVDPVPGIDASTLSAHASNPILGQRIVGREDVDIAALINKLEASDWVADGRGYFAQSEGKCPFCQQEAPPNLADDLAAYFNESFKAANDAISELISNYDTDARCLQAQMDAIEASDCTFLYKETVKGYLGALKACIAENKLKLDAKKKEPSRAITLDAVDSHVKAVADLITAANAKVTAQNKTVDNLDDEQTKLTEQVWRYLLDVELKIEIEKHEKARNGLQKAIESLERQITDEKGLIAATERTIRDLERTTTSSQPTIDGINQLLTRYGFSQFALRDAGDGRSYQLVRADGSDAKKTLSEGEKGFVTFLYFYHLLKGSNTESGMTTDRVVIFDDPVSSLDSDVLFIVSSLIKGLCDEVRAQQGSIRQVFVLTHNIYFHREITFDSRRHTKAKNEKTFWTVRRCEAGANLEKHDSNPIRTSYDLLWDEVRRDDRANHTLPNTLRRILEHYFKILGRQDFDSICEMFEGRQKLICRSLFFWVNDGSHYTHEDLYVSESGTAVDSYLDVFRMIFDKTNHSGHYNMMMGLPWDASVADSVAESGGGE